MTTNNIEDKSRRAVIKAVGAGMLLTGMSVHAKAKGPVVETQYGKLEGFTRGNVNCFYGIRYGQPIAGKNRFKPPQPVKAWSGVKKADTFANSSPQQPSSGGGRTPVGVAFADDPSVSRGDDCLALNVWAPANVKGKLSVMVWFHGGGFSGGSGSSPLTNGTNLAGRGDVIVVTVNHRLAASGYVDFSRVLGGDFADSDNLGTKDMVAALKWVNTNIEAFGGDTDRVMIFGESGGGWKVSTLMGVPSAKGLFQRAAIQSGPLLSFMSQEEADKVANIMLEELGVTKETAHKIHDMSFEDIVAAEKRASARFSRAAPGFPAGFWPVVDGEFIVDHVFDPVANASAKGVSLLIGQTGTEMSLFMIPDKAAYNLTDEQLDARVTAKFGEQYAPTVLSSYRQAFAGKTPSFLWFRMISDAVMGTLLVAIADAKMVPGGAPVYTYRFEMESPIMEGKLYSPHTLEIPFVFDTANEEGKVITGGGEEVKKLASDISSAWVQFAKTGNPSVAALPAWPEYSTANRATMHLDVQSKAGTYMPVDVIPIMHELVFNQRVNFFG
ncbi:carboxylesterase/lipase family protein [Alteromonas lipolytica]|uniref:Carboxylic ester hydrolase n=1 Tax=Alteromonas lipolytica TaxID=1856405 RepID=A0A1E8FI47_9ALTE|nr:carboxylesterase family protein [Alteromonas lipolytica]OFI35612.1 hypothetical protein BFC17_12715 [Alteromonas lipolytica]GGF77578.1 carboxylic ester hydrolase [Alteromonas lipolytica]